mgnify:CR=1 FL=1
MINDLHQCIEINVIYVRFRVLWLDDDFAAKRRFFLISVSVSYCFALDFDHSHTRIASQFEFTHAVHVIGFNLPTHIRVAFSIYQSLVSLVKLKLRREH